MATDDDALIDEQVAYYRARAAEYDEWFLRQGRYDRGGDQRSAWLGEIAEVERWLAATAPFGDVLELACGTGLWTRRLVPGATSVTAVDASPEMLAINRARNASPAVRYVQADLFAWRPDRRYHTVFFGFWLSHVPTERFETFWSLVGAALAPDGRVFFVDSQRTQASTAVDHPALDDGGMVERRLNDGRTFRVVKHFYEPAPLAARLADLGWTAHVARTAQYFIHGQARPAGATAPPPEAG